MRNFSRVPVLAASLLLCVGIAHGAVSSAPRIMSAIDSSQTSQLPDNVPERARRASDLGAVADDSQLTELSLRFSMTAVQQKALTQLLADQQNPASPRFHQWLTPEQFGDQFGLAPADLRKVSDWLRSQGFKVTQVARGRTFLRFSGTVAQARSAFHTQIHRLSLDGENHVSNLTSPVLPAAIAGVTNSITGLNDFHPRAHHHEWIVPDANPAYTSAASGNHFVAPGDFYTIYDENPLLTSGINGSGITIAVMGQVDINLSDIATFRSLSGLSATVPTITVPTGETDPGPPRNGGPTSNDLLEAELDVEWSGATAPSANILFVNTTDTIGGSLTQSIDQNLAPILSLSYGECETAVGQGALDGYTILLQQANAQGQTVVSAAGDSGATDCDYKVASATRGMVVDFPAALPYVTGIGGTMFSEGAGTYWSATNGTNSGSALSYIPEAIWNEDSTGVLSSGGGGSSAFYTKPYWQVGTGVPADSARDVPDISFNAASSHDGYLVCTSSSATPPDPTANYCVNGYKNSAGLHDIVGGTSVGAPSFAGIMALVVQKTGGRVGNANPNIYALANSSFYSSVFHDTTTGTNASPCTVGTTQCPGGVPIGYSAGVGYDRASGWGTIDVFNFVNSFNLVTPLISTIGTAISSTSLTAAPTSVLQGASITLTATVSASSTPVPTGTVQFLVDNVAFGSPVALSGSGNTATYSLNTATLSGGAHTAQAAYSGDTTYAGSKATAAITVVGPDFTLTPSTISASVKSGSTISGITFTVTGTNNFAGNVTFSVNTANGIFTPNPVAISTTATTGTTILSITTATALTTGSSIASSRHGASSFYEAGTGIAFAGLLVIVLPRRRRFVGVLAAVISVGMLAAAGCGSGSSSGGIPTALPGTYNLTVTAVGVSGNTTVTHTATVVLTVQ